MLCHRRQCKYQFELVAAADVAYNLDGQRSSANDFAGFVARVACFFAVVWSRSVSLADLSQRLHSRCQIHRAATKNYTHKFH